MEYMYDTDKFVCPNRNVRWCICERCAEDRYWKALDRRMRDK